jgi:hypothetical protein
MPYFPRQVKRVLLFMSMLLGYIGVKPHRLLSLRFIPKYLSKYIRFKKLGGHITHISPIISDYQAQAGSASGHYFHQDLLVASLIYKQNPRKHIDVGSRIDGFVAHVASFRKICVMDIRDLEHTGHYNISFLKSDLADSKKIKESIADSVSCLHAIEHFGLGRYTLMHTGCSTRSKSLAGWMDKSSL